MISFESFYFSAQLGWLPVPGLPWLPICLWNGVFQALEWLGSPTSSDPVHPQGERHADASQGLLRYDCIGSPADRKGSGSPCSWHPSSTQPHNLMFEYRKCFSSVGSGIMSVALIVTSFQSGCACKMVTALCVYRPQKKTARLSYSWKCEYGELIGFSCVQ